MNWGIGANCFLLKAVHGYGKDWESVSRGMRMIAKQFLNDEKHQDFSKQNCSLQYNFIIASTRQKNPQVDESRLLELALDSYVTRRREQLHATRLDLLQQMKIEEEDTEKLRSGRFSEIPLSRLTVYRKRCLALGIPDTIGQKLDLVPLPSGTAEEYSAIRSGLAVQPPSAPTLPEGIPDKEGGIWFPVENYNAKELFANSQPKSAAEQEEMSIAIFLKVQASLASLIGSQLPDDDDVSSVDSSSTICTHPEEVSPRPSDCDSAPSAPLAAIKRSRLSPRPASGRQREAAHSPRAGISLAPGGSGGAESVTGTPVTSPQPQPGSSQEEGRSLAGGKLRRRRVEPRDSLKNRPLRQSAAVSEFADSESGLSPLPGQDAGHIKMYDDDAAAAEATSKATAADCPQPLQSSTKSAGAGSVNPALAMAHARHCRRSLLSALSTICSHRHAYVFMQPVTEEIAPGYSSVVYEPVDLTSVRRRVEATLASLLGSSVPAISCSSATTTSGGGGGGALRSPRLGVAPPPCAFSPSPPALSSPQTPGLSALGPTSPTIAAPAFMTGSSSPQPPVLPVPTSPVVINAARGFVRDLMLMFVNARMYNNQSHEVHKMAGDMFNDIMVELQPLWSVLVEDIPGFPALPPSGHNNTSQAATASSPSSGVFAAAAATGSTVRVRQLSSSPLPPSPLAMQQHSQSPTGSATTRSAAAAAAAAAGSSSGGSAGSGADVKANIVGAGRSLKRPHPLETTISTASPRRRHCSSGSDASGSAPSGTVGANQASGGSRLK